MHALRHSLATNLLSQGFDTKTVQDILRHSNVHTALQLYSHGRSQDRPGRSGRHAGCILHTARRHGAIAITGKSRVEDFDEIAAKPLTTMVSPVGIEPTTAALKGRCSTN